MKGRGQIIHDVFEHAGGLDKAMKTLHPGVMQLMILECMKANAKVVKGDFEILAEKAGL